MAFFFLGGLQAFSQNAAPNYFHADPMKYKHRLVKTTDYSTHHEYEYDENNRLSKLLLFFDRRDGQTLGAETQYFYNEAGYMIRSEESAYYGESSEWSVGKKEEFTRDANGYITHYSRFTPKDQPGVLVEDIRIDFTYDSDMKLIGADINSYDVELDEWSDLRTTKLTYNANGLLHEVIQLTPEGNEYNREVLSYNNLNKIISIEYLPTESMDQPKKWIYEYNSDGDIVKAGREFFWFYYEYETDKMASEIFFPRPSIADLVYFGPKNYVGFSCLPLDNSFKHAVVRETENGYEYMYESVPTTGLTDAVATSEIRLFPNPADKFVSVEVAADMVGQIATVTDMSGRMVLSFELTGLSQRVDVSALHGTYMLKIGQTVKKLIVK